MDAGAGSLVGGASLPCPREQCILSLYVKAIYINFYSFSGLDQLFSASFVFYLTSTGYHGFCAFFCLVCSFRS